MSKNAFKKCQKMFKKLPFRVKTGNRTKFVQGNFFAQNFVNLKIPYLYYIIYLPSVLLQKTEMSKKMNFSAQITEKENL